MVLNKEPLYYFWRTGEKGCPHPAVITKNNLVITTKKRDDLT